MWRLIICSFFLLRCLSLSSQNVEPIMKVLGVSDPTEIEAEDMDRLEKLMSHPLNMNAISKVVLEILYSTLRIFNQFKISL